MLRPCTSVRISPSPAPTPPRGRTMHEAAQPHTGALALAGSRSPHARFFLCSSWVPAPNMRGTDSSTPWYSSWLPAASHVVRPHASLRVALVQPRERGGKLLAQRYRQRTEALAVGKTNRKWTVREVLCYPLPPVPHFAI